MDSYISRTLDRNELVLCQANLSLWPFAIFIAIGAIGAIGTVVEAFAGTGGAVVSFLFAIALWGWVYLEVKTTELAITTKRLIAKKGIISRHTIEILLNRVESIRVNQGIVGRILGYGTVVIIGTGATREAFPKIVDPLGFRRRFMEIQEAVRAPNDGAGRLTSHER